MFELKNKKIAFFGVVGYLAMPIIWKMAESGADLLLADFNIERAVKIAQEISDKYPGQKFEAAYVDSGDFVHRVQNFSFCVFIACNKLA